MESDRESLADAEFALLIQEGKSKDPAVVEALVNTYGDEILRLWRAFFCSSIETGNYISQRTFIKKSFQSAFTYPGSVHQHENIRAWLYAHAVNVYINNTRSKKRLKFFRKIFIGFPYRRKSVPNINVDGSKHDWYPDEKNINHQYTRNLCSLPDAYRLPLILHYGCHLPTHSVAKLLREPEDKLEKCLAEAKQQVGLGSENLTESDIESYFYRHLGYSEENLFISSLEGIVKEILGEVQSRSSHASEASWLGLHLKGFIWILAAILIFFSAVRSFSPTFIALGPTPTPIPTATAIVPIEFSEPSSVINPINHSEDKSSTLIWKHVGMIKGDHGALQTMAVSPTGGLLAAGLESGAFSLWNLLDNDIVATGRPGRESNLKDAVTLAFSPDGKLLAVGGSDESLEIWDTRSWKLKFRYNFKNGGISKIAFSGDSRYFAVVSGNEIWIWEFRGDSIALIKSFTGKNITTIAFSPITINDKGRKQYFLALADGRTVWVRSVIDGEFLLGYRNHKKEITDLEFSPNGEWLASGSSDRTVKIVQIHYSQEGNLMGELVYDFPLKSAASDLSFSPTSSLLAVTAPGGPIYLWNLETGGLDYPPIGLSIAVTAPGGPIYLRNLETGSLDNTPIALSIAEGIDKVDFYPEGQVLFTSSREGNIHIWAQIDVTEKAKKIAEPRYFRRSSENNILWEVSPPVRIRGGVVRDGMTLKEVEEQAGFKVQIPARLPDAYSFVQGFFDPESQSATVIYFYRSTKTYVYIRQQRMVEGEPYPRWRIGSAEADNTIGHRAAVEWIELGDVYGEFVPGRWLFAYPENPDISSNPRGESVTALGRWSPDTRFRIRWQNGHYLFEIDVPVQNFGEEGPVDFKNEMIDLAKRMVFQGREPLTYPYEVEEGDTCYRIAGSFGTSVEEIAHSNDLNNCELIATGQTLLVPIPNQKELIAQADLNCDGRKERVFVIPDAVSNDSRKVLGVILEATPLSNIALEKIGYPHEMKFRVWEYTFDDVESAFFGRPVLIPVGVCEQLLAVNVYGKEERTASLKIFRWDGIGMKLVLDGDGWAELTEESKEDDLGSLTVTTSKLEVDPITDMCRNKWTKYAWNEDEFTTVATTIEYGVSCTIGFPVGYP